jgi:hypothetical protein
MELVAAIDKIDQREAERRQNFYTTAGVLAQSKPKSLVPEMLDYLASVAGSSRGLASSKVGAVSGIAKEITESFYESIKQPVDTATMRSFIDKTSESSTTLPTRLQTYTDPSGGPSALSLVEKYKDKGIVDPGEWNRVLNAVMEAPMNQARFELATLAGNPTAALTDVYTASAIDETFYNTQLLPAQAALVKMGIPPEKAGPIVYKWAYGDEEIGRPGSITETVWDQIPPERRALVEDGTNVQLAAQASKELTDQIMAIGGGLGPEQKQIQDHIFKMFLAEANGGPQDSMGQGLRDIAAQYEPDQQNQMLRDILVGEMKQLGKSTDPYDAMIARFTYGDPEAGVEPIIPGVPALVEAFDLSNDPYAVQKMAEWFQTHRRELDAVKLRYATDPAFQAMLTGDTPPNTETLRMELRAMGLPSGRMSMLVHDRNPVAQKRVTAYAGPLAGQTRPQTEMALEAYAPKTSAIGQRIEATEAAAARTRDAEAAERVEPAAEKILMEPADQAGAQAAAAAPAGRDAGAAQPSMTADRVPVSPAQPRLGPQQAKPVPKATPAQPGEEAVTSAMSMSLIEAARMRARTTGIPVIIKKLEERLDASRFPGTGGIPTITKKVDPDVYTGGIPVISKMLTPPRTY